MRAAGWMVAIVVVGVASAGCGLLPAPDAALPIEELSTEPRQLEHALADIPTGPPVEVLSGEIDGDHLSVVVQKDADGVCMAIWRGAEGGEMCGDGLPGGDRGAFGVAMTSGLPAAGEAGDGVVELAGLVGPDVEAVIVELRDGREGRATLVSLEAAELDVRAFVLYLPAGVTPQSLVARGRNGIELQRQDIQLPASS